MAGVDGAAGAGPANEDGVLGSEAAFRSCVAAVVDGEADADVLLLLELPPPLAAAVEWLLDGVAVGAATDAGGAAASLRLRLALRDITMMTTTVGVRCQGSLCVCVSCMCMCVYVICVYMCSCVRRVSAADARDSFVGRSAICGGHSEINSTNTIRDVVSIGPTNIYARSPPVCILM